MGLLDETLAYLDARRKFAANQLGGLLSDGGDTARQLWAQVNEDARNFRQQGLLARQNTQSAIPELQAQGQDLLLNQLLNVGGMGGITKGAKAAKSAGKNIPASAPEDIVQAAAERTRAVADQPYPQFPASSEYAPWNDVRPGGFRPAYDPKEKKWFVEKIQSPEEQALAKRISEAEQKVAQGDAVPMWDFGNLYRPPQQNVRLAYATRAKGVPDWIAEQYGPAYQDKMVQAALAPGIPNAWKFYWTGPVRDDFLQQLGAHEGPDAFQQFASNMGATTTGAKPYQNVRFASYHDVMQNQGLPVPIATTYPYGHNRWNLHQQALQNLRDAPGGLLLPPEINPKGATFSGDISGLTRSPTFDEVMTGPKGQGLRSQTGTIENAPFKGTYGFAVDAFDPIVAKVGRSRSQVLPAEVRQDILPSDVQSKVWAELGGDPSYAITLPEHISNRINVTAMITGLSPYEVKRRWIMKQMPLLGLGGGGLLLGDVSNVDEGIQ